LSFDIDKLRKSVDSFDKQADDLQKQIDQMREKTHLRFKDLLDKHQATEIYPEFLESFLDEPWVMIPKKGDQWYVIAPKFVKLSVGYPDFSTKSFNVFIVNKYAQWLAEIPTSIQEKLKFPAPLPFKVYDGMLLTGTKHQDDALKKYNKFLYRSEGRDRIRIKKGYEFKLIAQLVEDGILPFVPRPVSDEDLRTWNGEGYKLYREICDSKGIIEIQDKTWSEFVKRGAMGIFWAFSAGKSLFGHRIIGNIVGPHLVIVDGLTLKQQWLERIAKFNPKYASEVRVETYHSYQKVCDVEWKTVMFDECHHLPAQTFIRLSTIRAKYRLGMSGSPFREDGRENYIFALTGFPWGMSWNDLLRLQIIKAPSFRLYILKDKRSKETKIEELLRIPIKTIIFCDSLDYGEYLAKKFEVPFIQGATPEKERLEMMRDSDTFIASRVADQGISLQDLERSIEVAFLMGSRMQESQRFGRLMHSEAEKIQHIIIMTEKEYDAYNKRLGAIYKRGFKMEVFR
jgi:DNA excision repair protein ERCC-3